jgi:hypothetical protein
MSTFFTHKGEKQTSQLKPLRLCGFARVFFFSLSREAAKRTIALRLSAFARVLFLFSQRRKAYLPQAGQDGKKKIR